MYIVKPLLVGIRETDQGILTYQRNYGKKIWLPIWSFLVQGNGKKILVDTGLDVFSTPEDFVKETGLNPLNIEAALVQNGLSPEDIDIVINTHLHDDHCANNPLFSHAVFYIQKKEIESCRNPHPIDYRYDDSFIEDINIHEINGDFEPLDGIKLIFSPGHTPGCQTVQIKTEQGLVIIPGFCSNNENFPSKGLAPCLGVHCDAYLAYDTAQKVLAMEGMKLPLHEVELGNRLIPA